MTVTIKWGLYMLYRIWVIKFDLLPVHCWTGFPDRKKLGIAGILPFVYSNSFAI